MSAAPSTAAGVDRDAAPAPLSDLTVIEVAADVAGQFCGKSLAGLGARVIKVEPPAGDPLRMASPFARPADHPGDGLDFLWLNTNKESVTLDIESGEGRQLLDRLLARADVFIVGMSPLREAPSEIAARFPELVVVSISPFGLDGPHAAWKADGKILAAAGGWTHMSGKPDREPLGTLETLPWTVAGLAAASAALMGIHERRQSGLGQMVEVSAQEVLVLCTAYTALSYSYSGVERPRSGMPFPMTIVPSQDGHLGVNVLTQAQWEGLCHFAGLDALLENPDFATPLGRALRSAELTGIFAEWAAGRDAATVFHEGQQWRVPFGYVPALADVFELEPHVTRGFFERVAHPAAGQLQYPRPPFLMEGTPPVTAAPAVGQHDADFDPFQGGER